MRVGGIVLCGGKSRRMGTSKADLPFGDETMLQRVVRLLATVVEPIAVVAAPGQPLPALGATVVLTRDRRPDRGPLEGLAAGFQALGDKVDAAYATSCDVPLLTPAFVKRLIGLLGDHRVVVPVEDRFTHPLAALYHRDVLPEIEQLLKQDRLRPVFLFEQVKTRRVPVEDLRDVDPELTTLANLNDPQAYAAALRKAGLK